MNLRPLALLAAGLALTGFACQKPAPANTVADEQAIRNLDTQFNNYIVATNDSIITSLYAADGVLLPPNEPPVAGTANIRKYFAAMWPMGPKLVVTPTLVKVTGDMAFEDGTWTFSATTPAGPMKDNGKYLVIWTRSAGGWKILRDMWSSDNPAPTAAVPAGTKQQ
jgi:ketosteroid isomerase-like protein